MYHFYIQLLCLTDVEIGFFFSQNNVDVREEENVQDTMLFVSQTGLVDIPVSVFLVPINGTATGSVIMTHTPCIPVS